MTKTLLLALLAIAALQGQMTLRATAPTAFTFRVYWLPLLAVCLFFCALAFAARGVAAPIPVLVATIYGATIVGAWAYPSVLILDATHLAVFLAGPIALLGAVGWLARQMWAKQRLAPVLVACGACIGTVALSQGILEKYVTLTRSESLGLGRTMASTLQFTALLGIGATLIAIGGLVSGAECLRRRAPHNNGMKLSNRDDL